MENRRRLATLQVNHAVVTHLTVLKERFHMAKECVKSLMSAKDSYKSLTKKRREFWKSLLSFSGDVRIFNKNLSGRFPSKTPKSWHKARKGFAKGIKLMESVTELYKTYYATTTHFQTALERFEQVSERFWESEDTLANFHDRLGTMNPDEILAVQLPDFLWIHNNLYPDHKDLLTEWTTLNLTGSLKTLRSELADLKSIDFSSSDDEESEECSDYDTIIESPETREDEDDVGPGPSKRRKLSNTTQPSLPTQEEDSNLDSQH